MYLNLILGLLVNGAVILTFGRFFSKNILKSFIQINFFFLVLLSLYCFFEVGYLNEIVYIVLNNWINLGFIKINLGLFYDSLTMTMVLIVIFISSLVHLYSFSYMKTDPYFLRFIGYLSLFTFFMLILVTSNNYLQLLIGWEGVGLSSYLLICFWYTRVSANLAAIKAMLINRIGDVCLIIVICIFLQKFGSVSFGVINNNFIYLLNNYVDIFFFEVKLIDILCLFLLLGAMGKSAQIILHVWLPDAMEGPTPVSALIHAATMVTAGIFLIIRSSKLFEYSPNILFMMVFIGSLTCLVMSIIGVFQQDIKKIVAYSTCSQLGYMFIGCGLSSYTISLFHLFNHAFFKALLFLSMGVIIHALGDEQDLRKMGGLINMLPLTSLMVFFGSYALLGLPFLAGFYSKDILLEIANVRVFFDGYFSYSLGILGAFFTAFYSTRLMLRVFFNNTNIIKKNIYNIHEADNLMYIPLIILLLCSFFVGYFFFDIFVGLGSNFFNNGIYTNFTSYNIIYIEFDISNVVKFIPLFVSTFGFFTYFFFDLKYYIYYYSKFYRQIFNIIYNGFFFDKLYIDKILIKLLFLSKESYYFNVEAGIFQKFILLFINNIIESSYINLKVLIKGFLHVYIFIIIFFFSSCYLIYVFFFYLQISMFLSLVCLIFFSSLFKWDILVKLLRTLSGLYKKKNSVLVNKFTGKRFYFTSNSISFFKINKKLLYLILIFILISIFIFFYIDFFINEDEVLFFLTESEVEKGKDIVDEKDDEPILSRGSIIYMILYMIFGGFIFYFMDGITSFLDTLFYGQQFISDSFSASYSSDSSEVVFDTGLIKIRLSDIMHFYWFSHAFGIDASGYTVLECKKHFTTFIKMWWLHKS